MGITGHHSLDARHEISTGQKRFLQILNQHTMKYVILTLLQLACCATSYSQSTTSYAFEPSPEHPFGLPNQAAPPQLLDFAPLIGECDCTSVSRNADQTWAEPVAMTWRFKYILNGMGVQDETLKADGTYAGSIRQFNADSSRWYVHYYTSVAAAPTLPAWEGNRVDTTGKIILYRDQAAPNGTPGWYKISFYEVNEAGFKWLGEWVNKDESFVYPTWKIDCKKRRFATTDNDRQIIQANTEAFSAAYIRADYEAMARAYTADGKIFPNGTGIITGYEAIKAYWVMPAGTQILAHQVTPLEIKILGNYAYDFGYYQGQTRNKDGSIVAWKGKYVIVWKRENNDWRMFLDIWNRVVD
jgi:ketosteroid isomerase-like protein